MKICFIVAVNPEFLGGISLYMDHLIEGLKSHDITWIYKGRENRIYKKKGVNYIEVKVPKAYFWNEIVFNKKVLKILKENNFDVINSHAVWGYWLNSYRKTRNQKIIHTYHGSAYHFYRNGLKRFSLGVRSLGFPLLLFSYLIERPPWKNADEIICVSDHLKEEFGRLYGQRQGIKVIRTGVDLNRFKPRDRIFYRERLGLEKNKIYGLYVGRGGYWTKGLDKIILLSEGIYNRNKNYRLIVIGSDKKKVSHLINKEFIIFLPIVERGKIHYYYNSADIFFSMSRCEGGAPTMVTSEAMASGCLIATDKEANQEVFEDEKNGLIISKNYVEEVDRVLKILKNKNKLKAIVHGSLKTARNLSIDKWRTSYLSILIEKSKDEK